MAPALAVIAAAVAGCANYAPDSFRSRRGVFPGQQFTVGCLDVAVDAVEDPQAVGAVAEINFGNRCDTRVSVDLTAIAASGRDGAGRAFSLAVFDPNLEIRPAMLDARGLGREVLEFVPAEGFISAHPNELVTLCLDLSRLDGEASVRVPVVACMEVPAHTSLPAPDLTQERAR